MIQLTPDKLNRLYQKCWSDTNFKQQLLDKPVDTIERFFGETITDKEYRNYIVSDQSNPIDVYINIPPNLKIDDLELSDAELERVAGGLNGRPIGGMGPADGDIYETD